MEQLLAVDAFEALSVIDYFTYLDGLRESGVTNMMGAGAFLQGEYAELDRWEAWDILIAWMKTFDSDRSAEDRAYEALGVEAD